MVSLTKDKIERLLGIRKTVLDNIKWELQSKQKLVRSFSVNVISEMDDMFELEGYLNESTLKIWLTLKYDTLPLISLHKGKHRNPENTEPITVYDWHKHPQTIEYGRDYAYDVNHEFNINMTPQEKIDQFFIENNLTFAPGKKYFRLFSDYKNK